jgi:hypothetical protein
MVQRTRKRGNVINAICVEDEKKRKLAKRKGQIVLILIGISLMVQRTGKRGNVNYAFCVEDEKKTQRGN